MRVLVLAGRGPTVQIALETAVRLQESLGAEVIAAALEGPLAEDSLRRAVSAGCRTAVRITGTGESGDLADTSASLASIARDRGVDLILIGGRSGRIGMNLLGPAVAEALGASHVGSVAAITAECGALTVDRRAEGVLDTIEVPLPAVISVEWGPRLRYPSLPDRFRGRRADIEDVGEEDAARRRTPVTTRVLRNTGPKPRRKLAQRTGSAMDHVMSLLLGGVGGVGGGGGGRLLEGEGEEVAAQIVAACLPEMEGL